MTEFINLNYEKFAERAKDPTLSKSEKIGFPNGVRDGIIEWSIFFDILSKIKNISECKEKRIIDIGCGCGELPKILADWCKPRQHELLLIDSPEMLEALGPISWGTKLPGKFPRILDKNMINWADIVIAYSVLHHVYTTSDEAVWVFLDGATALLDHGGELLLGDLPNLDRRARHELPETQESCFFTDHSLMEICRLYRRIGYDVFILPQPYYLPFYESREDILIRRI